MTSSQPPRRGGTYIWYRRHDDEWWKRMLPKPVPALTDKQWEYIAQRLDKPAPAEIQERLKQAIENAKKIKED